MRDAIDQVDERAERRRLAGARRPRDEHEALGEVAELLHLRRDLHLLDGHDLRRNLPEHRRHSLAITQRIRAKARAPGDLVSVIGVVRVAELDAIALRHDRAEHAVEMGVLERVPPLEAVHLAVQADDRRLAAAKVQIGRAPLDRRAQELLDRRARFLAALEIVERGRATRRLRAARDDGRRLPEASR